MPPESSPSAPHPASGWTQHRTELRILLAALILAIIVAIAWYLGEPSFFRNLFGAKPSQALPGMLIMNVYSPWTDAAHHGVSGAVLYTPVTGARSSITAKTLPTVPLSFSADGKEFAGIHITASTTQLVYGSVSTGQSERTIASVPSSGAGISPPVWSSDGQWVAYQVIPSLRGLPLAPDGKPYFVTTGATSTLRTGLTLPSAYQPHTIISHVDGTNSVSVSGLPIMFSSDSAHLLVVTSSGLAAVSVTRGTQTAVTSAGTLSSPTGLRGSPDGTHLINVKNGTLTVYAMDWNTNRLSVEGTIGNVTQATFGDSNLLVEQGTTARVYNLSGSAPKQTAVYELTIPNESILYLWQP